MNANANKKTFEVITPKNEEERGCQVSILMPEKGKEVFDALKTWCIMTGGNPVLSGWLLFRFIILLRMFINSARS